MQPTRQLPLPFPLSPSRTDVDFIAAPSNEAALTWLARPEAWPLRRLVLYGPPGSGKTHLLHSWCARMGATLWSGPHLRGVPKPAHHELIALDDADLADERALFHLLNAAGEQGSAVLLAGRDAPARWQTRLPDLASRLRASLAVAIGPAEEALLRPLLTRLLAERQLDVPLAVQSWLLSHLPREAAALVEAVARLDRAAMGRRRGITRALAAEIVTTMENGASAAETASRRADNGWADEFFMHPSPPERTLL